MSAVVHSVTDVFAVVALLWPVAAVALTGGLVYLIAFVCGPDLMRDGDVEPDWRDLAQTVRRIDEARRERAS